MGWVEVDLLRPTHTNSEQRIALPNGALTADRWGTEADSYTLTLPTHIYPSGHRGSQFLSHDAPSNFSSSNENGEVE